MHQGRRSKAEGLWSTFARSVQARRPFGRHAHLLLAVSGGPDSMALLHLCRRLQPAWSLKLSVASVDHGLRAAAHEEQAWVGAQCQALGVPFVPLVVDAASGSGNVAARARRLRYAALLQAKGVAGADVVATGHTLDDQAETVLRQLLRSVELSGLGGVQVRRADGVVRPLIDCRRSQILHYLRQHELSFVEDPTNHDRRTQRARLRHDLLPALEAEAPGLSIRLAGFADEVSDWRGWQQAWLIERAALLQQRKLTIAALTAVPPPLRRSVLRAWVQTHTGHLLSARQLAQLSALSCRGQVLWVDAEWQVRWHEHALWLEPRPEP